MTPEEFRHYGHQAIDWIAEFLEHVERYPVLPPVKPGELRSEEHTSELQSLRHLVCRLLLEKKNQLTHFEDEGSVAEMLKLLPVRVHVRNHLFIFFFLKGGAPRALPPFPHPASRGA